MFIDYIEAIIIKNVKMLKCNDILLQVMPINSRPILPPF